MTLKLIITYIIGPITPALNTALVFCILGAIARLFKKGIHKNTFYDILVRWFVYLFVLFVGYRMDTLGISSALLGWQGTTQLLAAVWITVSEIKDIWPLVRQIGVIPLPNIMGAGIGQSEQTPDALQNHIDFLQHRIGELQGQLQEQTDDNDDNPMSRPTI